MRSLLVLAFLLGAVAIAGCGSDDAAPATTAGGAPGADEGALSRDALTGRTFGTREAAGRALVPGSEVVLTFEPERLGAHAGCNTISGPWRLDDGTLRFDGDPSQTMIGCEPALHDQDEWLASWLAAGVRASAADGRLVLEGGGVTLTLSEREAAGPPPIAGTRWTLDAIGDRDTVASVPAGVRAPTLLIGDDGRAAVFAGCNSGGGPARVRDDGFVEIGPLALTRKACGADAARVEAVVLSVLDGESAAGFEGRRLVLSRGGRHLTFRADG